METEKSGQSVQAQFPMENREGMSPEILVAHFFEWRHFSSSLYQEIRVIPEVAYSEAHQIAARPHP